MKPTPSLILARAGTRRGYTARHVSVCHFGGGGLRSRWLASTYPHRPHKWNTIPPTPAAMGAYGQDASHPRIGGTAVRSPVLSERHRARLAAPAWGKKPACCSGIPQRVNGRVLTFHRHLRDGSPDPTRGSQNWQSRPLRPFPGACVTELHVSTGPVVHVDDATAIDPWLHNPSIEG